MGDLTFITAIARHSVVNEIAPILEPFIGRGIFALEPGRVVVEQPQHIDPGIDLGANAQIVVVKAAVIAIPIIWPALSLLNLVPKNLFALPLNARLAHQLNRSRDLVRSYPVAERGHDAKWRTFVAPGQLLIGSRGQRHGRSG